MKQLIKLIVSQVILFFLVSHSYVVAQEEEVEKDNRPVRSPFESGILLDNQTVIVPTKGTLQFEIQHRFGTLNNGIHDFFGMWAPSNIRLGLGYVPWENIMVAVGATKFNQFVDISYKWNFLKQTRSWSIPVGLTFYGFVAIDTRGKPEFEDNSLYRVSYFNELIIASRINSRLSIQLVPSFTHFNAVDSLFNNSTIGITFDGRYKLSPQTSFIFEYDMPVTMHDAVTSTGDGENKRISLPNTSVGFEISTSTHAFQIFVANYQSITYHQNIAFNTNDFFEREILVGFNITRLWNF